jgi:CRP/FNR family transcriptional regulator, cyclic AMP receptor protein
MDDYRSSLKEYTTIDLSDIFGSLSLFQGLSPAQLADLRPLFRFCQEPMGVLIFEQGDPAEYLYIVVDGEAVIRYKPEDGPAIIVAHVMVGGVVGWSSALGSPIYSSGAVCRTDCKFLRVRGRDLRDLCVNKPETGTVILERLAAVVAERLRNTHASVLALLEQGMGVNGKKLQEPNNPV